VTICTQCGKENRQGARFCDACATPLAAEPESASEVRKVVSVLFCDVTGSTELGEQLDPEALRVVLAGYFERMRAIVERHGGTVEKFIGDAVMAVFGVPVVHEDDALRAVRAAVEMRDALPSLGVRGRIGVMTGEVVSGTLERLATGDAVNVAARLEQAAEAGEVLIGAATFALVSGAVEVEPVEPLGLKGKAEPVPAYRLVAVRDAPGRRHDARFVGRERELALLGEAWERVRIGRLCELVSVIGDAGVGKSRLVAEALSEVDATLVRGRCLPYGEGITYWPVVEVLKQLGAVPPNEAAAATIRSLLGGRQISTSVEEIAWAFRKTVEHVAKTRPVVVVFDDIQWGEPAFLDLVEHMALLSSGASILLVCIARLDLAERRPTWPTQLRLEPLGSADVADLIANRVPVELRERIARAAGGNPLYVEEMLAMAGEAEGEVVIPPTLRALLAARLDQLEPAERMVLERAAIEGEVFHRGAVLALAPEETQVTPHLAALARKGLIRADRPQLVGEDGFRFRHLLIRDAAYEALPKATRAELHLKFAAWLERHGSELVESDQLAGWHLEQALRYSHELGFPDDPTVASRAADHLAAAGRKADARTDVRAAANLLGRALSLLPSGDPRRPMLAVDMAQALVLTTGLDDSEALLDEASNDPTAAPYATLIRIDWLLTRHPEQGALLAERELPSVFDQFRAKNDHRGLARAEMMCGGLHWIGCRAQAAANAWERAAEHARYAHDEIMLDHALSGAPLVLIWGPFDPDTMRARLAQIETPDVGPRVVAQIHMARAELARLEGDYDAARDHVDASIQIWRGLEFPAAGWEMDRGWIEIAAGNYPAAIRTLQSTRETLSELGDYGRHSTATVYLAKALYLTGQMDEAEQMALDAEEESAPEDVINYAISHEVRARIHTDRGDHEHAEQLARSAVDYAFRTDFPILRGNSLLALAHVLHAAGQADGSADAVARAIACYDQKGDRIAADRARAAFSHRVR
jgi:class 3 adenylate cyclase/tetratricopeptide (TPR) repeat protein